MAEMTIVQAVNHTLDSEMAKDDNVVVLGEDVGKNGGVFRATDGLWAKYGENRVIDTPLAESGIIGAAIGMALYGLRPVPEIQFMDFIYPAFDQIVSEAAKIRYRSGGQYSVPMVIRTPYGGGIRGGHYHSQSTEAFFAHTAGLKVVVPSNPYDTKGLLLSSIRDPDPVLFMEPKRIYRAFKQEVPDKEYTIELGKAKVTREGSDVSVIAYGAMHQVAMQAAEEAAKDGTDVEVLDLRSLVPLDEEAVLATAKKTGRVVVLYEAAKFCGYGAEISALIAEEAIEYMEAPIARVGGFDTPFPYSLENMYLPSPNRVLNAIDKVMEF
jgi:pyruvate dehydrogenase E1 component beta subunit